MEQKPHVYRMVIVSIFVIFIAIIVYAGVTMQSARKPTVGSQTFTQQKTTPETTNKSGSMAGATVKPTTAAPKAQSSLNPKTAWVQIKAPTTNPSLRVGETVELTVNAFSQGVDVNGYDVVLGFNPDEVEIISVTSSNSAFDIFQQKKSNYIVITGGKRLSEKSPTVFQDTELVKILVKAKKPAKTTIAIRAEEKKLTTKFVDQQVHITVPQINSVIVEIR